MGNAELDNEWVKNVRAGLAARKNSRPTTKMGAVRLLWPEIEQALHNGQTLKDIRDWLEAEGLSLRYSQFTFYVRRIRLRQAQTGALPSRTGLNPNANTETADQMRFSGDRTGSRRADPLSNVKSREARVRTFEYSPEFDEKDLL